MSFHAKRRWLALLLAVLLIGALGVGPASGIVYGEPDNGDHPYVGSMVFHVPDFFGEGEDLYAQACSGTLVQGSDGGDVFLTAAHCLVGLELRMPEGAEVLVTFDESISPTATYYTGDVHFDERFGTNGLADLHDVGVIVLHESTGIDEYATVAPAGYLDQLKKDGALKDQMFTTVGYGTVRETRATGFAAILDNLDRRQADQSFQSLNKAWLNLSMNQATGNGGTCYGDSGGPHLVEGTSMIVSVTTTGDRWCKNLDKTYRVDTATAQEFLADFVALP